MTDEEVTQLYRCLLGRDPEDASTVAAFRGYYPTAERGRRAIFGSDEFDAYFARTTGRTLRGREHLGAALALTLLARAAAAIVPAPNPPPPRDEALRAGMQHFFPPGQAGRLALVVGEPPELAIDDLLPLGGPEAAILHVSAGFPPVVPLAGALGDGTTVFRLGGDADSTATILQRFGRKVEVLAFLARPADPGWVEALQPYLAAKSLLVVGPAAEDFDPAAISAAISALPTAAPVQHWHGLLLHHVGGWLLPVTYTAPPAASPAAAPERPDPDAYPSLAIAAIVRDEAVCVQNMLRSALGIASFYAVLDTGSIDATPALARTYLEGCGVPFVFASRDHAAFDDDFGAMRNAALDLVPDWIEWVLMLDADEELVPEDHAGVLQLIAEATHEAYALPRYNFPGADKQGIVVSYPDRQVRLLRHTPDRRVHYSGVVHETVRDIPPGLPPLDGSIIGGSRGGPHIHHLVRRFRSPEQEERKQEFYREIASRQETRAQNG